ncbi:hypothetical protein C0J52_13883 [Blattella germanica]|nr:hypothetical protein C0J52_13883 [Blattella germanica]
MLLTLQLKNYKHFKIKFFVELLMLLGTLEIQHYYSRLHHSTIPYFIIINYQQFQDHPILM